MHAEHVYDRCMASRSRSKHEARVEEQLLALILRANRARIYDDLLRGAKLSIDKALYPVLSATAAIEPARVADIAEVVGLNPTTTSRHLSALEREGLVSRATNTRDARAAVIALTPRGKRAIRGLRDSRRAVFARLLADFDESQLQQFGDYLQRLQAAFAER
jgi:DNA-binding MarR family transcriptional regulator